jgi:uracil-DNA glycosylase family 4
MNDFREAVDATIAVLETMKRDGVTHVEISRETLEILCSAGGPPAVVSRLQASEPLALQELAAIEARAKGCTKCSELSRCRHSVVFGTGSTRAELMFIGEAPGADEDAQGEPFVGRAGQLLTKIITAMGYTRDQVYITNVLKCRPPQNRTPLPDEVQNCLPYMLSQIELVQPKVIVALGAVALRALLDVQLGITKMRGHWYTFRGIPIMPTFHPAYLLRNPAAKREVWQDIQAVMTKLGKVSR